MSIACIDHEARKASESNDMGNGIEQVIEASILHKTYVLAPQ